MEDLLKVLIEEVKQLNNNISNINKEVFTAEQAAEYLEIGYSTILHYARTGQIECSKNGTDYVFRKEYLINWLDKNKKGAI